MTAAPGRARVVVFRDFREDRRTSMDVYADELVAALRAIRDPVEVAEYRPAPWFGNVQAESRGSWRMRISRYAGYPLQVRSRQGAVNHVIDHGYGHLLYALDPERTVVTVHDLIPLLSWRGAVPGNPLPRRPWLSELSLRAAKRAARVIAVSERTKADLVAALGFPPERVTVIPNGLSARFQPQAPQERERVRSALGLAPATKAILITGWQPYKNHKVCARVFAELLRRHPGDLTLLRLGRETQEWRGDVARSGIAAHVRDVSFLPSQDMPALYSAVDLLLFPSTYEGFGWPPLEAMACGTPVVASTAGSLPEVLGSGALLVDANDIEALAAAAERALFDADARAALISRGFEQAGRYTWERCAEQVAAVYREVERAASASN